MSLQKDTILNERYVLVRQLGKGSFGEVWLANDLQLGIEVAVKVYVALDGNGCKEFGREYLRMHSLSHTNLLRADHYALYGDRPFLVMEYCPSGAKELIGKADELTLLRFIRDVASGLAYMHEHDMLHRDIKPDNILQKPDGTFVLTDFGLSKNMHSTLLRNSARNLSTDSVSDMFSGTVEYMAPELFTPDPLAVKATDVWALGVTLYEIIMGELPFFGQGGNMMNFGAAVPNIHAPLSENLKDTIKACMKKNPWDRPTAQTLADWAQDGIDFFSNPRNYPPEVSSYPKPSDSLSAEPSGLFEPPVAPPNEPLEWEPSTDEPKRRKIWPLLAASIVLLVSLAGFLVWKFAFDKPKGPKAEAKLFADCRKKNDVGLYRYYVMLYPKGDSVAAAKAWIKKWELDSIAETALTLADPTDNQPVAENSKTIEEKNAGEKEKAEEKKKQEEQRKLDEQKRKKAEAKPQEKGPENDGNVVKEKEFTKETDLKKISEEHPALPEPGLLPDPGPSGLSPVPEMTEEEMAKNARTLEDCYAYVEKYGNKGSNISTIRNLFQQLYAKKLGKCITKADYEKFLQEHDVIMKKMRIEGGRVDINWRERVEHKIKELELSNRE